MTEMQIIDKIKTLTVNEIVRLPINNQLRLKMLKLKIMHLKIRVM